MRRRSMGILGGTFDPVHRGHTEPVREVAGSFEWESILFVPAWAQPFKAAEENSSAYHRYAMIILAVGDDPEMKATFMELERARTSYTVETLEALREGNPDTVLDWIIGDDHLESLERWRSIERILELANFAVLRRGGDPASLPRSLKDRVVDTPEKRSGAGSIVFAVNRTVPVSATEIRARVRRNEPLSDLVHPAVERYIARYGLYTG
ncbi:MAG TPA: nicotinate-nucleotide adenylyltransferase [Thermoanaerobaculia bacterium]|nr:nicotinate-nucleotide adenylyltransferase [Thermoanaerobaculia bacterium]